MVNGNITRAAIISRRRGRAFSGGASRNRARKVTRITGMGARNCGEPLTGIDERHEGEAVGAEDGRIMDRT